MLLSAEVTESEADRKTLISLLCVLDLDVCGMIFFFLLSSSDCHPSDEYFSWQRLMYSWCQSFQSFNLGENPRAFVSLILRGANIPAFHTLGWCSLFTLYHLDVGVSCQGQEMSKITQDFCLECWRTIVVLASISNWDGGCERFSFVKCLNWENTRIVIS